jgi:RNA polymerase primary sigma factor
MPHSAVQAARRGLLKWRSDQVEESAVRWRSSGAKRRGFMPTGNAVTGLGWYLDQIKATPLLTAAEEKQLARRIRAHSDPVAREEMIQANLRLVVKIAKEYSNPSMTLADLVAEGNLGLVRAVEDFDPDAGVRFSTYAAWWIKQSIKRAMVQSGQPIRVPAYLAKLIGKWRRAAAEMEAQLGRTPGTEEMAKKLGISAKKASLVEQGLLAVAAPTQMGSDNSQAMSEMLSDDEATPEQVMMDEANAPFVRGLLVRLGERERRILELRFHMDGYDGPQRTFKEIGKIVGLTRERVRQLEKKAREDLKKICDELL